MKKTSIIITFLLLLIIFIYGLILISENNKCTSVRAFNFSCLK